MPVQRSILQAGLPLPTPFALFLSSSARTTSCQLGRRQRAASGEIPRQDCCSHQRMPNTSECKESASRKKPNTVSHVHGHRQGLLHLIHFWCWIEKGGAVRSTKAILPSRGHLHVIPGQGLGCVGEDERGVIKRENNAKRVR